MVGDCSDTASVASFTSEFSLGVVALHSASTTPRQFEKSNNFANSGHENGNGRPPLPPSRSRRHVTGVTGLSRKVRSLNRHKSNTGSLLHENYRSSEDAHSLAALETGADAEESELNMSMESLDNLDDFSQASEWGNLRLSKSKLNASMTSLLSDCSVVSSASQWRRNCRLVKKSSTTTEPLHNNNTTSSCESSQKENHPPQKRNDVTRPPSGALRSRLRQNQQQWKELLSDDHLPFKTFKTTVQKQASSALPTLPSNNKSKKPDIVAKPHATKTRPKLNSRPPPKPPKPDAILKKFQEKLLQSASSESLTSSGKSSIGQSKRNIKESKDSSSDKAVATNLPNDLVVTIHASVCDVTSSNPRTSVDITAEEETGSKVTSGLGKGAVEPEVDSPTEPPTSSFVETKIDSALDSIKSEAVPVKPNISKTEKPTKDDIIHRKSRSKNIQQTPITKPDSTTSSPR